MRAPGSETGAPSSKSRRAATISCHPSKDRSCRLRTRVHGLPGDGCSRLPSPVSRFIMMLHRLAPAALIAVSTACFATRNDVRILQEDILSLRSMQAREDSARARQLADISATLDRTLVAVRDSVRELGTRLVTFQGSTRQELYSLGQQLLQLGEFMGQSQAALRNFSANMEERNRQA